MLWNFLCGAILPASLAHVPEIVTRFLGHLGRCNEKRRIRTIDHFLALIGRKGG
jgi:hypothetical protein